MNIFKKIFHKQFEDFEQQINDLNKKLSDREKNIFGKINEIYALKDENFKLKSKTEELEKENEMLKKYYKLDEEPSDEIKAKIHIDLEVNRLKEEKMQLTMLVAKTATPQLYPIYYPPLGRY